MLLKVSEELSSHHMTITELNNQHLVTVTEIAIALKFSSVELKKSILFTVDKSEDWTKQAVCLP